MLDLKYEQAKASPEEHSESRSRQFARRARCYAPIWDLPAAFVYCCRVTVLEWDSGHVFIVTPVTKLGSSIIHFSTPRIMIPKLTSMRTAVAAMCPRNFSTRKQKIRQTGQWIWSPMATKAITPCRNHPVSWGMAPAGRMYADALSRRHTAARTRLRLIRWWH